MAAGKDQDITLYSAQAFHDVVSSSANLRWRFSAGATVTKQLPVGTLGVNLRRPPTLVFAIVPLDQIGIGLGYGSKAGQFGRSR